MSGKTNPGKTSSKLKPQLDAVLVQLGSPRPSEVWRGMEQIRYWLKDDPESGEVYGLLLDAVKENRELRERARSLLEEMMQKGSKSAEQAMRDLPSSVQDYLADANDAYYAAEYDRAIQLYRQVLRLDPGNAHAQDHLNKAEIKRRKGESDTDLPRAAQQYYRRARSYIAARDIETAMSLLGAAIESAQAKGMEYPDAEEALNNMQNLLTADEFRQKAKAALEKDQWDEAVESYKRGLTLDPANELMKKELETLQDTLYAETALKKPGILKIFMPIGRLQETVEAARDVINPESPLLSFVEKQLSQIRLLRGAGVVLLLALVVIPLFTSGMIGRLFSPAPTNTPTATQTQTATFTPPATPTVQPTETAPNTPPTDTNTPAPTPTETLTPTLTQAILGIGYINKGTISIFAEPNKLIGHVNLLNQQLTILEERKVGPDTWYRCRWEQEDGVTQEAWILSDNITFGSPPN